jgi:ubiquinone/menaquinone biosynthesis C-methylase UbiE
MTTEEQVARHYTHGSLERAILDALKAGGKDIDKLTASDLSGVDEFHLGWRQATAELARGLAFTPAMHVLDIGSGIGGPARHLAGTLGCRVTGIDLTEEFVTVAKALTRRCGLAADRVSFQQASALDLPFEAGAFDGATLIHVGMNIADKAKLFGEVRRVLRPGARFGVYDVMRVSEGEIPYPMPWAASVATSFVEKPEAYRQVLSDASFAIEQEHNRREFTLKIAQGMREAAAKGGPAPVSLQTLMGGEGPRRLANVMATLERGTIAPVEIIARAL